MATIFFSYSHADEALRDRLEVHLALLKRQGVIETWHDRRIAPGEPIDRSIGARLDTAEVILLLVSPDFVASDYCYDVEMTRALERHERGEAVVIPVILRPCDWQGAPFGDIKALPKDGKPVTKWPDLDEAFLDITNGIKEVLRSVGTVAPGNTSVPTTVDAPRERVARSSNLRIAKIFSERDRDEFLHGAFEYMANYFEASLEELQRRNAGVEGRFRRIDANRFTAVVYRYGKAASRCTIFLGGLGQSGIAYSNTDAPTGGGFNESLSVREDGQALYLEPLGLSSISRGEAQNRKLTLEGGAEMYWGLLIEPLQRR
jgi:hypothetical protein